MINPIIKNTLAGRRNIPRYLYHLTTKENYNSMLKDGFIKNSHDVEPSSNLEGVFLFEMINFVKRWGSTGLSIDWLKKPLLLLDALILQAATKNPEIVLLKIPTKNFLLEKLRCRVQNIGPEVSLDHANNGDFATNGKHYTRKKYTIEYIYENNIPITEAIKLGEIDTGYVLNNHQELLKYYENMDGLKIMSKLLQNQLEQKSVELAKNSQFKIVMFED